MSSVTTGVTYEDPEAVYKTVQDYYGRVLSSSADLKTSACTTGSMPRYVIDAIKRIPRPIVDKYYGCGTPIPTGIEGLTVLDLGCGSGRDCYIASALVGETGSVIGVDMTAEQLSTARAHVEEYTRTLGYSKPNLNFVEGYIEFLEKAGIKPGSVDVIISNCVINLSPDKKRVLREAHKVLREGGEIYFSDVYCNRRLPKEVRNHDVMLGECLGGALYVEDFLRICREIGFTDPRSMHVSTISIDNAELRDLVGEAKFYSITFRCFKLANLEHPAEDYGQIAVYQGGVNTEKNAYQLDESHRFEKNRPVRVCGNTAAMVGESWLRKYFRIIGTRDTHFGPFPCGGGPYLPSDDNKAASSGQSCGPKQAPASNGGCCPAPSKSSCGPASASGKPCC